MKYLRIDNDTFGFVADDIYEILSTDKPITEEEYQKFFELQSQGKQFKLKEIPSGKGLFDYVEEFTPEVIIDTTPTMEDRISALEMAMLESLIE